MARTPRPAEEHRTTAQGAGLRRFSPVGIVAGTLCARVADPEVGPAAAARSAAECDRERAERLDREHHERVGHDALVAHDVERRQVAQADHDRDGDGRVDRAEPPAAVDPRVHHAGRLR